MLVLSACFTPCLTLDDGAAAIGAGVEERRLAAIVTGVAVGPACVELMDQIGVRPGMLMMCFGTGHGVRMASGFNKRVCS